MVGRELNPRGRLSAVEKRFRVGQWLLTARDARGAQRTINGLPDQVIDVLLAALERGDFYIICPDDEVTPEMDRRRILWSTVDMTENRPPLSRWHPNFAEEFKRFST